MSDIDDLYGPEDPEPKGKRARWRCEVCGEPLKVATPDRRCGDCTRLPEKPLKTV